MTCLLTKARIHEFRELLQDHPGHRATFYIDLAHVTWDDLRQLQRDGLIIVNLDNGGLYPAGKWAR